MVRAVFDGLFLASTVAAVAGALDAAGSDPARPIAVVGDLRLARALGDRGRRVLILAPDGRGLRRLRKRGHDGAVQAAADHLPIRDRALAALVGVGAASRDDGAGVVAEWARGVAAGGALVLVDRAAPPEASRIALCGGLTEIAQRTAGRGVVTSGVVPAF
jgi:hypothetical protein